MPLDLSQVWLATSTSGKALGALPGLALVFHNEALTPAPDRLPRYLDLGLYNAAQGVPFTILTSLVYALDAALAYVSAEHLAQTAVDSAELRRRLAAAGLHMVAGGHHGGAAGRVRFGGDWGCAGAARLPALLSQSLFDGAQLAADLPHGRLPRRRAARPGGRAGCAGTSGRRGRA